MSYAARMALFGAGAIGLAGLLGWAIAGLPSFGRFDGEYARLIARLAVPQRHATDAVTAVNFDYRALDTLGEELILFTSVAGLSVLLREQREEHERPQSEAAEEHSLRGSSYALRALTIAVVGLMVVLSLYVDSHGAITPGGGFQGGVIGAAALLMVFLGGGYLTMKRLSPHALVELAEASGAGGYALIGVGGIVFVGVFFQNFLGLGTPGELISAGTIPLSSMAVALEVTGAFVLLWGEFLDQTLIVRPR